MFAKPEVAIEMIPSCRRRPLRVDTPGDEERPSKKRLQTIDSGLVAIANHDLSQGVGPKAFVDTAMSSIKVLNNEGILLHRLGYYQSSLELFRRAHVMVENLDAFSFREWRLSSFDAVSPNCMFQRMDFDEGMNLYNGPEPIQGTEDLRVVEATLLFNMGQVHRAQEVFSEALLLYRRALQCLISVYGSNGTHGSISSGILVPLLHSLGLMAYLQGKPSDAVSAFKVALLGIPTSHEAHCLTKGLTLNCLGVALYHRSAEDAPEALKCFEESLAIVRDCLGQNSLYVATIHNNMGRIHVQMEDFEKALSLYEKALHTRQVLGINNLDFAATSFNVGQSYHQLGELDKAITYYRAFLDVASVRFANNHRDIAVVLSGIAQIYQQKQEHAKALALYEKSLIIGRASLGCNHAEIAMLLNRMGNFHFERENYHEALRAYREGLRIERLTLEKNHPNIIVTLSNIGEIYRQQTNHVKAIAVYKEVLELQRERFGPLSAEVGSSLNIIGLVHDQKGEPQRALHYLQEALVVRRVALGDDHLDVSGK